jgi:hypothetical protein
MAAEGVPSGQAIGSENLASLPEGGIVLVGFEPSEGEYSGHAYLIEYVSPGKGGMVPVASALKDDTTFTVRTKITDIIGDVSREVKMTTDEFVFVFTRAIGEGRGYAVAVDANPNPALYRMF